jgi:hypothetical protein
VWPRGLAAKRLGLTQVPVYVAEQLKGHRCRPIGAWTRSQPVGCQGTFLLFYYAQKVLAAGRADEGPTPPAVAHRDPTNPTMPALCLQKAVARPGPSLGCAGLAFCKLDPLLAIPIREALCDDHVALALVISRQAVEIPQSHFNRGMWHTRLPPAVRSRPLREFQFMRGGSHCLQSLNLAHDAIHIR